ncbi:MliC family protein [Vibrio sinaloensis]|uniref:MliC family protein n=1 Tax=Vibrio TaxID=662 RepID=UPI0022AFDC4E|nr:MliC family protein [Vibrio sinaloensis]MCZ4294490.1 MliC family protein [Vibrio sinaloensis]
MKSRVLLTAMIGLVLTACSYNAVERDSAYQGDFEFYQCSADKTFKVAFMPNQPLALLRLPEHDYRLVQVPSGSGTKYILDDGTAQTLNPVTLYTKGSEARLELGRVVYKNCISQ